MVSAFGLIFLILYSKVRENSTNLGFLLLFLTIDTFNLKSHVISAE